MENIQRPEFIRATITAIKENPSSARQYSIPRLSNVLDNLDPDYDAGIRTVVVAAINARLEGRR
jgi:hypothetical protein